METFVSLALKYRPKKIEDLIGQSHIQQILKGIVRSKKIPQAIMIVGSSGTGKTTIARLLARYINCENGNSCGECKSCKLIDTGKHPDIIELNAANTRNIDDIRNLIEKAKYKPITNHKFIILDEAHQLTPQAKQALLKPLEEPPKHTTWIVCTTEPNKFDKAMMGRFIHWRTKEPEVKEIAKFLADIMKKEGIKIKDKELKKKILLEIAYRCNGQVRDALKYLDNIVLSLSGIKSSKDVKKILEKIVEEDKELYDLAYELLYYIYTGDKLNYISLLNNVNDAIQMVDIMAWLNSVLIDYVASVKTGTKRFFYYNQKKFIDYIKSETKIPKIEDLLQIQAKLTDAKYRAISGMNAKNIMYMLIL